MYIGILKDGTELNPLDFWDWCGMNVCIHEYIKQGYRVDDACNKFWDDVRNYDTEDYDYIMESYEDIDDAVGNGAMDELRADYLHSIGFNYRVVEDDYE